MATLGFLDPNCSECGAPIKGGIVVVCPACLEAMHRVCWEEGKPCPRSGCGGVETMVLPREMSDRMVQKSASVSPPRAPEPPRPPSLALPIGAPGEGTAETSLAKLATLAASLPQPGGAINPAATTLTGEMLTLDARYGTVTRQIDGAIMALVCGLGFLGTVGLGLSIWVWSGHAPAGGSAATARPFLATGLAALALVAFVFARHQVQIIRSSRQELEDLGKLQEKLMEAYQDVTSVTPVAPAPAPAAPPDSQP